MAFGRDANVRWIRAEESENVSAMLDTIPNRMSLGFGLDMVDGLVRVGFQAGPSSPAVVLQSS
jgi:hypothetical protein